MLQLRFLLLIPPPSLRSSPPILLLSHPGISWVPLSYLFLVSYTVLPPEPVPYQLSQVPVQVFRSFYRRNFSSSFEGSVSPFAPGPTLSAELAFLDPPGPCPRHGPTILFPFRPWPMARTLTVSPLAAVQDTGFLLFRFQSPTGRVIPAFFSRGLSLVLAVQFLVILATHNACIFSCRFTREQSSVSFATPRPTSSVLSPV